MGIKYIEAKKNYEVSYSRRHPVTKTTMGIKRTGIKTMEEAKMTFNGLIILMEKKISRSMFPLWLDMVDRFLEAFRNRGLLTIRFIIIRLLFMRTLISNGKRKPLMKFQPAILEN